MQQGTLPNIDQEIDCTYIEPGTMLEMATQIAYKAHEGQNRRSGEPYVQHPIAVSELLSSDTERVIALLHDVMEDTTWTYKNIISTLNRATDAENYELVDIMLVLLMLTHDKAIPYYIYIENVARNATAARVKLADICHNMSCDPTDKQKKKYLSVIPSLLKVL